MKTKIFFSLSLVLIMCLGIKFHTSNIVNNDVLIDNIEALASGEISFDFCIFEPNICTVYENGFTIKGTLQYTGNV